jgi:hypothetical protein
MPSKKSNDSTTKKWAAKPKTAKSSDLGNGMAKGAADKLKARKKMLDSI